MLLRECTAIRLTNYATAQSEECKIRMPAQRAFQRISKSSVAFFTSTCKVQVPGISFKSPESRDNSALSDSAVNTVFPFGSRNVHTALPDLIRPLIFSRAILVTWDPGRLIFSVLVALVNLPVCLVFLDC